MVKTFRGWRSSGSNAPPIIENQQDPDTPYLKNSSIKGYMEKFLDNVKRFSAPKKVDMLYKAIVKKAPTEGLSLDKKLNRMLYEHEIFEKVRETKLFTEGKNKKKFRFSPKARKDMKKSRKKLDHILVLFYTITGEILGPKLYPIYNENMVIIKNKPYELDPRAVWRFGKYRCISIKEIDRRPISNLDWDEIKRRGDATDSDEFLIKAAMRAYTSGTPQKKPLNKGVLIMIGIVVIGIIIFLFSRGGG